MGRKISTDGRRDMSTLGIVIFFLMTQKECERAFFQTGCFSVAAKQ
jgi:hypothetical protein